MGMFGPKMGTWTVTCESDPRFNGTGRAPGLVCEGGPKEMMDHILACEAKFGPAPKDCYLSFWKD